MHCTVPAVAVHYEEFGLGVPLIVGHSYGAQLVRGLDRAEEHLGAGAGQ
jgi:hypothetical protein